MLYVPFSAAPQYINHAVLFPRHTTSHCTFSIQNFLIPYAMLCIPYSTQSYMPGFSFPFLLCLIPCAMLYIPNSTPPHSIIIDADGRAIVAAGGYIVAAGANQSLVD